MSECFFQHDSPYSDSEDPQEPSQRIEGSELSSAPKSFNKKKYAHKLKDLGAVVNISPDGRLDIKPPKLNQA